MLGDTWHMEPLFPFLPLYHIKYIDVSSIHVTDMASSPESLCLIVCWSRAAAAATSWIMMVDHESEIIFVMADPVSCWLIVILLADPVLCCHLIVDSGVGPWLRWQPMVDPDGGSGSWRWIVDYGGIWFWLWILIVVAADHGLWLQDACLIYNITTQILDHYWQ